ncbi:MAG: hypothetical protein ACI84R_000862 [Candidatus Azotimanducaceae bacterium]|jgi:hypothetical protein
MNVDQKQVMDKIQRTATIGICLSTIAAGMGLVFIFYVLAWAIRDQAALATDLSSQLDLSQPVNSLTQMQAIIATSIWIITDILGVVMLMTIRQLFVGIKTIGIFTQLSALQLRRIGWLLFSLGPVSMVLNAVTGSLMRYWAESTKISVSVSLEDADVYAIVIGLVIVAVGHIMVSAAQLSEEHKAIV